MRWRLRRAGSDDAAAASLVAGASFLEAFAGILAGPDIVAHCAAKSAPAAFAAWIADPATAVTLAEHPDGGAPVGYSVLCPPDLPDVPAEPGDVELRRIYALSITRGTGLGAALMARALADAREMGAGRVLLGVLGTNRLARDFYERQGFAVIGERRFKVGTEWHDDVIYARKDL